MNARKIEMHHNTPEQVEGFLRAGLELVETIDPPSDLREACFTQAVGMLQARAIQWEQVALGMAIPRNNG